MKRENSLGKTDVGFGILLTAGIVVYLLRIQLGLPDLDESFYLTVPYRLTQGDMLLIDEWHVSQLVGFLIYPFMKVYLIVSGNTEGIYLAFRYIYLFLQAMVTVISYLLIKKRDPEMATVSCLVFFMFTVNCVKALSYNTIGLMAVWLFTVAALIRVRFFRIKHMVMGVLFAAVVLCNPYMIVMYIVYTGICAWNRKNENFFCLREWIWITAGATAMFVGFLLFLNSGGVHVRRYGIMFPIFFWIRHMKRKVYQSLFSRFCGL